MRIDFSAVFFKQFSRLQETDQEKIEKFIDQVAKDAFSSTLPGRNKKSDNVPTGKSFLDEQIKYAQFHNLWHYHVGIKRYETAKGFGKYTSEFVLHYQRLDDYIKIVKLDDHAPFKLPFTSDMK